MTENHQKAIDKLERLGTVIITGPAGIGKTTLADHLALHYVAKDYSLITLSEDIGEAEAVFNSNERQLFYFDDFLGRNYLEALSGHEGNHIAQFIKRITRDKSKRFILTSRTTILNQGKLLHDVFQINNLQKSEFEISFESFTPIDKAKILYTHLWHSSLSQEYIDRIYEEKRYRQIISHKNYNPRLINYITDSDRLSHCTPAQYWPYATELLDNPVKVWEHPFEAQHDDFGRALVLLVTLNSTPISQSDLAESFARYTAHPGSSPMHGRRDFLQSLKHLTGSFLSRVATGGKSHVLKLFNPSIGDFILHRYAADCPALRAGFSSLRSISSLQTLLALASNGLITSQIRSNLMNSILDNAIAVDFLGYTAAYVAILLTRLEDRIKALSPEDPRVLDASLFVAESGCPRPYDDIATVIRWRYENSLASTQHVTDFIKRACYSGANISELSKVFDLFNSLPEEAASALWPSVEALAIQYFSDPDYDAISLEDIFVSVGPGNSKQAEREACEAIESYLSSLDIPYSPSTIDRILEEIDIPAKMQAFLDRQESNFEDDGLLDFHSPQR